MPTAHASCILESGEQKEAVRSKTKGLRVQGKDRVSDKIRDKELVSRVRSGDRAAYQELVTRYQSRAYRIAFEILRSKEDAEDVVQESFVKAYLSLKNFRGDASFYTWLYRIVYNMSIDLKRKHQRRGGVHSELDESLLNSSAAEPSIPMKDESPEKSLMLKEQIQKLQEALGEISEEHRSVIMLRELEGMSYDEIADTTGVSRGTVMSRLHYARKKLQHALREVTPFGKSASVEEGASQERSESLAAEPGASN